MIAIHVKDEGVVSASVHRGAGGTLEACSSMPWATRLENTLRICETRKVPCVAVLDAPPTAQISSARVAIMQHRARINALYGSDKLLVLTGMCTVKYPVQDGDNIAYSVKPWQGIKTAVQWGMTVDLPDVHTLTRMHDMFSILLGSCIAESEAFTSTAVYPGDCMMPREVMRYMQFSDNVVPGSARASSTRGITADTTDGGSWSATVILQHTEQTESETALARATRAMLTSQCVKERGSAYFELCKMGQSLPPFVRRAMKDVHSEIASGLLVLAPTPMCRNASHCGQSAWR